MTNQETKLRLMRECLYCDSDYTRCNIKECTIKAAIEAIDTLEIVKNLIEAQEASYTEMGCDEFSEIETYYAIKEVIGND